MNIRFFTFYLSFLSFGSVYFDPAMSSDSKRNDTILLLGNRSCIQCNLKNAELVHADLTDKNMFGSDLTGANLNNAILDGSDLGNTNLTNANLNGASLRNVNFSGANLSGTDMRNSDLTGALLDSGALTNAFWKDSFGIDLDSLSYRELHNAGAEAIEYRLFPKAEYYFRLAIDKKSNSLESLMALAYTQIQLGKIPNAIENLKIARQGYILRKDEFTVMNIDNLQENLEFKPTKKTIGNGLGSLVLTKALSSLSLFAKPLFSIPNQILISR